MRCRQLRNLAVALQRNADALATERIRASLNCQNLEQQRRALVALAQEMADTSCDCILYERDPLSSFCTSLITQDLASERVDRSSASCSMLSSKARRSTNTSASVREASAIDK